MKKRIKILIPNATGPINIGDQAILYPSIKIIKETFPHSIITIHSNAPWTYKKKFSNNLDYHLIEWALFADSSRIGKYKRLTQIAICYIFLRIGLSIDMFDVKLIKLINDYKEADIIIFVGGGALRSRSLIRDGLSLSLLSIIYLYASLFNAKKIIFPMSFGPFRSVWHGRICTYFLKKFDFVSAREEYSYKLLKRYKVRNVFLSKDFALFLNQVRITNKNKKFDVIGLTVRHWFSDYRQKELEDDVITVLTNFTKNFNLIIQPIVQSDSKFFIDHDDMTVTKRVVKGLKDRKARTNKIINLKSLEEAKKIYSSLDLVLGMRMHSNIIAATQGVPFVAISYEHKTEGISKSIGMEHFCLKVDHINKKQLEDLITEAYKSRLKLNKQISVNLEKIRNDEEKKWANILGQLI